jgi:hypothetical protein
MSSQAEKVLAPHSAPGLAANHPTVGTLLQLLFQVPPQQRLRDFLAVPPRFSSTLPFNPRISISISPRRVTDSGRITQPLLGVWLIGENDAVCELDLESLLRSKTRGCFLQSDLIREG